MKNRERDKGSIRDIEFNVCSKHFLTDFINLECG